MEAQSHSNQTSQETMQCHFNVVFQDYSVFSPSKAPITHNINSSLCTFKNNNLKGKTWYRKIKCEIKTYKKTRPLKLSHQHKCSTLINEIMQYLTALLLLTSQCNTKNNVTGFCSEKYVCFFFSFYVNV